MILMNRMFLVLTMRRPHVRRALRCARAEVTNGISAVLMLRDGTDSRNISPGISLCQHSSIAIAAASIMNSYYVMQWKSRCVYLLGPKHYGSLPDDESVNCSLSDDGSVER